jgi:hypothetical protein
MGLATRSCIHGVYIYHTLKVVVKRIFSFFKATFLPRAGNGVSRVHDRALISELPISRINNKKNNFTGSI